MIESIISFVHRLSGIEKISIQNTAIINSQRLRFAIEDCEWLKCKSFIAGGWAMDNAALCTLFVILNNMKPKNILEFGLGQSSKMIHQYAEFYNDALALTIEHDAEWISFFCNGLKRNIKISIEQHDTILTTYNGFKTLSYKDMQSLCFETYDFFVIDGPFGGEHYSRSQLIDIAKSISRKQFCILIDDTQRNGEKETIDEVRKYFSKKRMTYHIRDYVGEEKQHTIICSENLKFLTSL